VIVQAGWYWARRIDEHCGLSDPYPVKVVEYDGMFMVVASSGVGNWPVENWPGEIGPMLAEQGPSKPVFRVEVSIPKMEAMIRNVALDALRTLADREPPTELLLAVWLDGHAKGSDGRLPTEYIDADGGVRRVLETWQGDIEVVR
jgi:hypothetical protein